MVPSWLARSLIRITRLPPVRRIVTIEKHARFKDQAYWENSLDASVPYKMQVTLRWPVVRPLYDFEYRRILGQNYLDRDNSAFFTQVDDLIREGRIPAITPSSRVFEPGCNVGAVLRDFQRRYGCAVSGLDISAKAIAYAREVVFKSVRNAEFSVGDVTDPGVMSDVADNAFTHVFTVAHLVHVPNGSEKSAYIETLKRVGRCVVLFERVADEGDPSSRKRHMEDYVRDYGFTLYRKVRKSHPRYAKFIGIFYYNKDRPGPSAAE